MKYKHTLLSLFASSLLICLPLEAAMAAPANVDTRNNLEANGAAKNNFSQEINIQLHPTAEVVGQGLQTVSFGLPLPPGAIVNTDNIVVVDNNNQEVPAFVRSLAAWNNMPPQSLLCDNYQSSGNPGIRSALIQFNNVFANNDVQNFRIRLNQTRQLSISNEVDVQTTLRIVNDGTYLNHNLGFQIREPKILAVIEPEYLSCTNLTTLSGKNNTHTDMVKVDQAQQDFFYTSINEFFNWSVTNDQKIDFLGNTAAYWLYDRPQTFFNAYIRSGNVDQLREALRAADHFKNNIYTDADCVATFYTWDCAGFFKTKNPDSGSAYKDSKYSYSESLVNAYLLTGDVTYLDIIPLPSVAVMKKVNFSSSTLGTERHRGNALLTTAMHYELTNDQTLLPYITDAIDQEYQRQQIALTGSVVNGCFNHKPEGGSIDSFSPWMSSLLANALLRAYQVIGDARIPGMLVDLAQCEVDRALYRTNVFSSGGGPSNVLVPYYIARSYGTHGGLDGPNPWSGIEHAVDVSLPIALGAYFATDENQKTELLNATRDLLKSHDFNIGYWTRNTAGRPIYRLAPPRKYNWQYKNIGPISWALDKLDNSGNSDFRTPVYWRHRTSGVNKAYIMNGSSIMSETTVNTISDLNWIIAGSGDFNGDGEKDLLWRNSQTGENKIDFMISTQISQSTSVNTVSNTSWEITSITDFDGNGKDDILWRHNTNGRVWVYLMDGATISSSQHVAFTGLDWDIKGTGDFDGDGKGDILWRNNLYGRVWLYMMNGANIQTSQHVAYSGTDWDVNGTGDFNGDGKQDILWRNTLSGINWMYLMNGTQITQSSYINTLTDLNWKVGITQDFNGDNKADIFWRHAVSGENMLYQMNGKNIQNSRNVNQEADSGWRTVE